MQRQQVKSAKHTRAATEMNGKRTPSQAHRNGTYTKDTYAAKGPILSPCSLFGPDGKERPGWELRVGEIVFGRADSKESLLEYYARIHEPLQSGHWRDRSWQPQRRVVRRARQGDSYHEDTHREDMYTGDDLDLASPAVEAWD